MSDKDLRQRALDVHKRLLDFYGEPIWRNPLPPVDELVSTILSQNTNDVTVTAPSTHCAPNFQHGKRCAMQRKRM